MDCLSASRINSVTLAFKEVRSIKNKHQVLQSKSDRSRFAYMSNTEVNSKVFLKKMMNGPYIVSLDGQESKEFQSETGVSHFSLLCMETKNPVSMLWMWQKAVIQNKIFRSGMFVLFFKDLWNHDMMGMIKFLQDRRGRETKTC